LQQRRLNKTFGELERIEGFDQIEGWLTSARAFFDSAVDLVLTELRHDVGESIEGQGQAARFGSILDLVMVQLILVYGR
jgi:hypothetical protein